MMSFCEDGLGVRDLAVEPDDQARQLGRVGVQQGQQRSARARLRDQPLLVLRQGDPGDARQAGEAAEGPLEVALLLGHGARGHRRVPQHLDEVGCGQLVGPRHLGEQLQVLAQGRQLDVHRLRGSRPATTKRVAELVTLALQGVRERVERGVQVGGAHGAQERVEVGEDALQLDVRLHPARGDDRAVLHGARRRPGIGRHELEEVLPEQRRGQDPHADVVGDGACRVGAQRQRDHRPVGRRCRSSRHGPPARRAAGRHRTWRAAGPRGRPSR